MRRPRRANFLFAAGALAGILGVTGPTAGQDEAAQAQPAPPPDPLALTIDFGYQYLFETDVDGGGEVDIARVPLVIDTETPIAADLELVTTVRYELNLYDFSGVSDLGPEPWDDIHTLTLTTRLQWAFNPQWRLWGGPFVTWSWESGADLDEDAISGGGLVGVTYIFNDRLALGGGVGVSSRIEEDTLLYPIILVNWRMTDDLTLTSRAGPRGIAAAGLELVYDLGRGWEAGVGGRYQFRRFRLDDEGIAPNGVGEEKNFPVWARLSYRFNENFKLDLYAGVALSGRLKLDAESGRRVSDADYDPTPTIALIGSLQF